MRTSINEEESESVSLGRERTAESPPTEGTRWGAVAAAVAATAAGATPAFTVGALTGPITASLGISNWTFGLALACFFAATALASPFAARPVERLGPAIALGTTGLVSGALMALMGQARSVVVLGALLAAAGLINALVAPATGRVLDVEVAPSRLSLSSGMVQASLFVAPLVAGLLVAVVAEPYGWRTALGIGGAVAALASLLSPLAWSHGDRIRYGRRPQNDGQPAALGAAEKQTLLLWMIAAAFGSVGTNTTVSFFVEIGTDSGFEAATAGLLLSGASVLAIGARAGAGALADLRPRANPMAVAAMLLIGAVGLVVLSLETPGGFLIGTLLLIAGVWSWHGLLLASAIRLQPASAAKSAAWLQVGLFSGPTVAPLIFGSLSASTLGIGGVVLVAAAATAAGAVAVLAGELYSRRSRES